MFNKVSIILIGIIIPMGVTVLITKATNSSTLGLAAGGSLVGLIFTLGAVGEMIVNAINNKK